MSILFSQINFFFKGDTAFFFYQLSFTCIFSPSEIFSSPHLLFSPLVCLTPLLLFLRFLSALTPIPSSPCCHFLNHPLLLAISLNLPLSTNTPPIQPPLSLFGFLFPSTSFLSPSYLTLLEVTFLDPCMFSSTNSHLPFLYVSTLFFPCFPSL